MLMSRAEVPGRVRPLVNLSGAAPTQGALLLLFIVLVALLAIYQQRPPAALLAGAPPAEFSSGRAMEHLRAIARESHPIGSSEQAAVRDHISATLAGLGIAPTVQKTTAINFAAGSYRGATVQNIVGRLPGTGNSKAVMLVAHYDSVPISPGASDDGAGVAALLETARALKASQPLKNDVIFLFTDGEEVGSLGAKAFMDEHPWAKDVGVVLNFEARGNGGPSIMFETSRNNGWLISEFARAAPAPVANSLSYEIYKRLPNDTDLSVFKKGGLSGLNFAYIDGLTRYHTGTDSLENINERSLQHHGSYALALTRHLGGLNLTQTTGGDAVYFNPLGKAFIHYPGSLALPLAGLVLVAFCWVVYTGFKRGLVTFKGIGFGFVALLACALVSAIGAWLVWRAVAGLYGGYDFLPWGEPYNDEPFMAGFVALTVGINAALYNWFRRKIGEDNLVVGGLLWWLVLTLLVSALMPGGSYLLTWPLLFALAGLGLIFSWKEPRPVKVLAVLALCAVPGLLLLSPMVHQLFIALTLNAAGVVVVLVTLLFGLLLPQFSLITRRRRWTLPAGAFALGLALIAAGFLANHFDGNHPRQDTVFYGLNADTGKAVWASFDDGLDEWSGQFFAAQRARGVPTEFYPTTRHTFLESEAPALQLPAPQVQLLEDRRSDDVRTLRLRITSPRGAASVAVFADEKTEVVGAAVNGKPVRADEATPRPGPKVPWGLNYYALPEEGVELSLSVKASSPAHFRVIDRTYHLPELPSLKAKPEGIIASASPYSDATLVSKSFTF
jgi:Peptidase family M28